MRLRLILLVLSILAVVSASTGGFFYYAAVRDASVKESRRQAGMQLVSIANSLENYLTENMKVTETLAASPALVRLIHRPSDDALAEANRVLDRFQQTLHADVCYLMNALGVTVASSNRGRPDSFVGQNFAFRPYFIDAMAGIPQGYLAVGVTSGKRGVYSSRPVMAEPRQRPQGVAVIKTSIEAIEERLVLSATDIVLFTSPEGVIFITNRPEWRFQLAWNPTAGQLASLRQGRQFGGGSRRWIGLRHSVAADTAFIGGEKYLFTQMEIRHFPGWKVSYLSPVDVISQPVEASLIRMTGAIVLVLCMLIGVGVMVLYHTASADIQHRRRMETALRENERRYRSLYQNTPAMLHSIDPQGRLLSVSDYWLTAMGYGYDEVIGRPLTDFMTEASRRAARDDVFPRFFREGFCKDVHYRYIRKNGGIIDILLSAIAERDPDGRIVRSLAVSVDVTEQKQAEKALRLAKEELSRYSKELERKVQLRTKETGDILRYTPAVIYIKDLDGRYLLVNSRFEELFGVRNEAVRGKTDAEILPLPVASQFQAGDAAVITTAAPLQIEKRIVQNDGLHTYLAIKFPLFDETGKVRRLCGIATDITAATKAQDQLRLLSASILTNQEKERAAISRELHDELGQVLTALRMDAVWMLERLKASDGRAADRARDMCRLIDGAIQDVRSLAFRLRPGILDDLGLVDALELYTTDFERRTGIACLFDTGPVPEMDDTVATAAYRIAQEALTNVARHAGAAKVEVRLQMTAADLVLSVEDDGKGFAAAALDASAALGMAGMRERASLAGGALEVHSRRGSGTRVRFIVPQQALAPAEKLDKDG